jgi:hypothetical protein
MTVRCGTLLRYMLRTFDDVDANVFGREILLQSELTLVGRVRCHNADKFLLIDNFSQQRRRHMAFIPDQGKIEPTVTRSSKDISFPTCEREAKLPRGECCKQLGRKRKIGLCVKWLSCCDQAQISKRQS